jgi:hypothetical protein
VLNGTYGCTGYENGLLAGLGSVTFTAEGQFVDAAYYGPNPPSQTAQWTYDAATQEIRFTPEIDIERGVYDPATDRLTFYLRSEASRAHAEGGAFGCQKIP